MEFSQITAAPSPTESDGETLVSGENGGVKKTDGLLET